MSQHRKARGRASEEAVADYLRRHGFPGAERRPASLPGSDITGLVGVDVEVKAVREVSLTGIMRQQAKRAEDGVIPVGVIRPDGWGPARVAEWPVVMPLSVAVELLRDAGHGEPLTHGLRLSRPPALPPTRVLDDDLAAGMRCVCNDPTSPGTHSLTRCLLPWQEAGDD